MDPISNPPLTFRSAATGYLIALVWHSWRALTFRHQGDGLTSLSNRHLALLVVLGVLVSSLLPPLVLGVPVPPVGAMLITAVSIGFARWQFGVSAATGFLLIMFFGDALGVLLCWVAGEHGKQVDLAYTLWAFIANLVFFVRNGRAQKRRANSTEK
jgi:hypothetical protein